MPNFKRQNEIIKGYSWATYPKLVESRSIATLPTTQSYIGEET